eukprot:TRINITY_DN14021_c0_g1_i7.p2 TRINITY_DN14021_c0_g1~~TRINITY_DN14021_c0_g1_i7.p2  ORF type:complete len:153 (-),score=46.28 TRINITY_DN14021_c0_g1_i7:46-504(-)
MGFLDALVGGQNAAEEDAGAPEEHADTSDFYADAPPALRRAADDSPHKHVICGASLGDSGLTCGVHLFNDPASGAPYIMPLPGAGNSGNLAMAGPPAAKVTGESCMPAPLLLLAGALAPSERFGAAAAAAAAAASGSRRGGCVRRRSHLSFL